MSLRLCILTNLPENYYSKKVGESLPREQKVLFHSLLLLHSYILVSPISLLSLGGTGSNVQKNKTTKLNYLEILFSSYFVLLRPCIGAFLNFIPLLECIYRILYPASN